jgi:hypothetical protein
MARQKAKVGENVLKISIADMLGTDPKRYHKDKGGSLPPRLPGQLNKLKKASMAIAEREMSHLERKQFELSIAEKITVLTQPHRRGQLSEMRESALGRFVEDYKCGVECYNAGHEYMCLVYKWRMACGINVPHWVRQEFGGPEAQMDGDALAKFAERVTEWKGQIKRCENALKATGLPAYRAGVAMIFDGLEPYQAVRAPLKRVLLQLAIEMGNFPY